MRSGSGRPTASSSSCTRRPTGRPCTCSTSATWSCTRIKGFSAVIGSWNTVAIRAPRNARIAAGVAWRRSCSSKPIRPAVTAKPGGSSPVSAAAVTDLPDPLSPTMHSTSPGSSVRLTSCTALARSAPGGRLTVRPSMASRLIAAGPAGG